jgi:glucosamine 6-phosphate synthetase-like amidotransferase/phosphosugar isomerase protein
MCGLTGIIFGKKKRSKIEFEEIRNLFTDMLCMSEDRGTHASGVATMREDGEELIYKLPVPSSRLITMDGFRRVVNSIGYKTTILMGHSRWRTVGSEFNNDNNQPIMTDYVLGAHNGTISNATALFNKYKLTRTAEVDSEILFRLAENTIDDGMIQIQDYISYLKSVTGSMSCVFVSKTDPAHIFLCKGDKPLHVFYNNRLKIMAYGSTEEYLISSAINPEEWIKLDLDPFYVYIIDFENFDMVSREPFVLHKAPAYPLVSYMKSLPKDKSSKKGSGVEKSK